MRWIFAAALLLPLTSCRKPEGASGRTVIRFLANPDVGGFAKDIIARFEKENPDIEVEMVEGPSSTNTREDMYAASFMAEEDTYDLVYMDVVWMPKFAAQGWLRPLDEWFTPEAQREFLAGDIAGSKYAGKTYRMPLQSDGGMLYYRKDLLAKAGLPPPKTWAELEAAAKKLQGPDLAGFVYQGKQYEALVCVFLELVWGNGGDILDDQGKVVLDGPRAVEALEWLKGTVGTIAPKAVLTFQEEEARHAFQEGRAVFMRNWPYCYNLMNGDKSPVKGKFGVVPMPHGPGGTSAGALGGWGYGISAFSKHPEAAWRFVEYSSRAEAQKVAFLKGGIIPTRRSLFKDPDVLKAAPHMKEWGKVLELARPRPVHPRYARISDVVQVAVSAAISGQKEPQKALEAAAKELRSFIK